MTKLGFFGGVYSNHLALSALLAEQPGRGIDQFYCLGDLGAFGPHPDRIFPLLREAGIPVVQGNYDHSIGNDLADCQCGYTDPRDNHFARLSYDYTYRNSSPEFKEWMRHLPAEIRFEADGARFLLCHGSPRQTNEFLWETTTSSAFLERMLDQAEADIVVATHTGLAWHRQLPSGRHFVNCGAIGRPANDGTTKVWYATVTVTAGQVAVELVPLEYPHEELARQMEAEALPPEFVVTIRHGWWTTCLEILPMKERMAGKF